MTPNIYSLESPEGIREIVAALLMGYNYRLYTEGQTLERAFLRSGLSIIGLVENEDFWINLQRDVEVGREVDADGIRTAVNGLPDSTFR